MVNFGYGPGMKYWREDRKGILAERLDTLVGKTKFKLKPPYDKIERNDEGVMKTIYPYVETDR
jgi:hypothetical protein